MPANLMNKPARLRLLLIGAALALSVGAAHAAGDVKRGSDVFAEQCAECHSVKEGKNKKGPSLFASLGRKSAALDGFAYSDAMKASGIVWSADRLAAYLEDPKKAVPGGKMKYDGLPDAHAREDLIAYLATLR